MYKSCWKWLVNTDPGYQHLLTISMGESNTFVSGNTLYRHLQQYCSHPSMHSNYFSKSHENLGSTTKGLGELFGVHITSKTGYIGFEGACMCFEHHHKAHRSRSSKRLEFSFAVRSNYSIKDLSSYTYRFQCFPFFFQKMVKRQRNTC